MYRSEQQKGMSTAGIIKGYADWVQGFVDRKGWSAFLMSFLFKPLRGSREAILRGMHDQIDRVFATFITRVVASQIRCISGTFDRF
jgi:hypothetical protein